MPHHQWAYLLLRKIILNWLIGLEGSTEWEARGCRRRAAVDAKPIGN